jgi:hypothetical protein
MKIKLLSIVLFILLAGCAAKPTDGLDANGYADKLSSAGLPIQNIIVYTAENDPNGALGHPNQYTSKVIFADTTIEQTVGKDPIGGTIEVFNNAADAEKRKKYLDCQDKELSTYTEYSYINGCALLRLYRTLTPDQAAGYEEAFMAIGYK